MKAWEKGAIVGGVWGVISDILGFGYAIMASESGKDIPIFIKILFAPLFLFWGSSFGDRINDLLFYFHGKLEFLEVGLFFLFPIFIGVLIGGIFGFLIEKLPDENK